MKIFIIALAQILLTSPAVAEVYTRDFFVSNKECQQSLEKTSATVFECVMDIETTTNDILIKKSERKITLTDCTVSLESNSHGYRISVARESYSRRPFFTLNEAKACLEKASQVGGLDQMVLTSVISKTHSPKFLSER